MINVTSTDSPVDSMNHLLNLIEDAKLIAAKEHYDELNAAASENKDINSLLATHQNKITQMIERYHCTIDAIQQTKSKSTDWILGIFNIIFKTLWGKTK